MKGAYQKLALVAGAALLVVFAAYYFKSNDNSPSVTRDTGPAPPAAAPEATPGDTRPIGVMPPAHSTPGANWPADQHPSSLGGPAPARALAATPAPPTGAGPIAGPALAQATPPAEPAGPSGTGATTTMPGAAGPSPFATDGPAATQPTSTAPAASPPTPHTYTIKAGDTFGSIAQQIYHSSARAKDIAQANPLVDPIKLKIGQVIKLPETGSAAGFETATPHHPAETPPDHAANAGEGGGNRKTYEVKAGDTLTTIARQFYHDRAYWKLIYNANRKTIGDSPSSLAPGMKLVIPPQPKAAHTPPAPQPPTGAPASQDSQ